jgi:hypothetical protein
VFFYTTLFGFGNDSLPWTVGVRATEASGGSAILQWKNFIGGQEVAFATTITLNAWHKFFVEYTMLSGTFNCYVDDVFQATIVLGTNFYPLEAFGLCGTSYSSAYGWGFDADDLNVNYEPCFQPQTVITATVLKGANILE